jgi:hypothetical protein
MCHFLVQFRRNCVAKEAELTGRIIAISKELKENFPVVFFLHFMMGAIRRKKP